MSFTSILTTAAMISVTRNAVSDFIAISLPSSGSLEVTAKAMVESAVAPLANGGEVSPRFYPLKEAMEATIQNCLDQEFSGMELLYLESCMVTPEQEREAGVRLIRQTTADMVLAEINRQCGTSWRWTPTA